MKRGPGSMALAVVRKSFPNVTKVMDAKADLTIEVTKRDDAEAQRKNHEGCAMAIACKRKLKLDGVIIARKAAYLIKGNKAVRLIVPERTTREVISFDRGGGFEPGTYNLDKPTLNLKLGRRRDRAAEKRTTHSREDGSRVAHRHAIRTTNVRSVLGSDKE